MKKRFSFLLAVVMIAAAFAAAVPASAAVKQVFDDVEADRWSAEAVLYSSEKGYMEGVGGGRFDPEGAVTRAAVATVLWRREGMPAPNGTLGFSDVSPDDWFYGAVAWAKETGVVLGVSDTLFDPDRPITREQLATMLFRYSATAPVSVPERADVSQFPDGGDESGWATEPLGWAIEAGLLEGNGEGELDPDGSATREQFAAMIERYDGVFTLEYNAPVLFSQYTEKPYPLVDDADFYVSTEGSDDNDGSFSHPFRTWERARDAVRLLKETRACGDITVAFMAGDYGTLSLGLTAEDSGSPEQRITYCKYGDGEVVFSDGYDLNADSFEPVSDGEKSLFKTQYAGKIKKTDVSALIEAGVDIENLLLFSDETLLNVARLPSKYADGSDAFFEVGMTCGEHELYISHTVLHKRLSSYPAEAFDTMKLYGYVLTGYEKTTVGAVSYDSENHVLTTVERMRDNWNGAEGKGISLCVADVAYELDFKNEYWIDRTTGTLYVYDPVGDYHILGGEGRMLTMTDASDVTLHGLTFTKSVDGFISTDRCSGLNIELCRFTFCGNVNSVNVENAAPGRDLDLSVTENEFDCTAGRALFVNGGLSDEKKFDSRSHVLFDNNLVSRSSLVYDGHCTVCIHNCGEGTLSHNRFEKVSRGAICVMSSYELTVEYNDFASTMVNSQDGGTIYDAQGLDSRGHIVRYNYFGPLPTAGIGQYSFYVDDASTGCDIYSNLMYNTAAGVMMHNARDVSVRDNVFFNSGVRSSMGNVWAIEEKGWDAAQSEYAVYICLRQLTRMNEKLWYEPYRAAIAEKWPQLLNYHYDKDRLDDPNFLLSPVEEITGNIVFTKDGRNLDSDYIDPAETDDAIFLLESHDKFTKYFSTIENNASYSYADNPVFVNPTIGDYRIRDGVDFPDIQFEKIGRY